MLGRVRRLGSLFALLWFAQLFACSFRVSRGTLHPNLLLAVPLGVAVAGIAASLPPPWCPRRSGPALALLGPGFASTALLAGLLGRTEAARWIGVSGILGPVLAALWLLWGWRERSPRAQRALRTHTVLLGLLVLSSLIGYGVFAPLRPPAGSPPTPGFSAFGVPFDDLTSVHRVVAGVLGLTSIVSGAWLLLGLPFAVDTSTTDLLKRRPREVPEDALWFEADRPRLHRGWMWFVGLGAGGTAVVALSNLVSGPWIQVPSWPLAILPWPLAAWWAETHLRAGHRVALTPDGLRVGGFLLEREALRAWDVDPGGLRVWVCEGGGVLLNASSESPEFAAAERWFAEHALPRAGEGLLA